MKRTLVNLASSNVNGTFDQLDKSPWWVQTLVGLALMGLAGLLNKHENRIGTDWAELISVIVGLAGFLLVLHAFFG